MPFPPALPPELIGWVARWSDTADLPLLALVSRTFHAESTRVLYRTVRIATPAALVAFNRTISEQESLARLVVALEFTTAGNAWHDTPWPKLRHLRHLSLLAHSMFNQLALLPSDLLDSFELSSGNAVHVHAPEIDALVAFLRRQRRLKTLNLRFNPQQFNAWSGLLGAQDLPALTSLVTRSPDVVALVSGCALRSVTCQRAFHSTALNRFLSLCPPGIDNFATGLFVDRQLSALFAKASAFRDLRSLSMSVIGLGHYLPLRALLHAFTTAEQLPSLQRLRALRLREPRALETDPTPLVALCKDAFSNWRKIVAPGLVLLIAEWIGDSIYVTVDYGAWVCPAGK